MRMDGARRIGGRRGDRRAATLVLVGAAAVVLANLVAAWLHEETGLFADTISNLAAGRYGWVLDTALVLFAVGMAAVGWALWRYRLDGWRWHAGAVLTGLVALAIAIIALYNEYGDGDTGGTTIHLEVVIGMAVAFTVLTWLLAPGLSRVGDGWAAFSALMGFGWLLIGLAYFFLAPDGWDGLIERIAAGFMVMWALGMALLVGREREAREVWGGRGVAAGSARST